MQVIGRARIIVGGQEIATMKGATLDVGGESREPVMAGGRAHWTAEDKPAEIECEIVLGKGQSLQWMRAAVDVTAQFIADTGQHYVIANAFVSIPAKITGGEGGKIKIKVFGDPAEEISL